VGDLDKDYDHDTAAGLFSFAHDMVPAAAVGPHDTGSDWR